MSTKDTVQKAMLIILDGWGIGDGSEGDVVTSAPTPFMDYLMDTYPHSQLLACGRSVGLPDGQMGNSEVGHLNIGAGRIVYQDIQRITEAVENGSLATHPQLLKAFSYAKEHHKQVHLVGLLGSGGVHALSTHMHALCRIATQQGVTNLFVHGMTDGRDTDPKSGYEFLKADIEAIKDTNAQFASLVGRYYGMDRDTNWDRIKLAYDLYTKGIGEASTNLLDSLKNAYNAGITDEFLKPVVAVNAQQQPITTINSGDVVICFNFRTDRLRQLTTAFTQQNLPDFNMQTMPLEWYTMTNYKSDFKNVNVIFDKDNINEPMGEVLAQKGLKQLRIAETEKYPHVTFFFSGGREQPFDGEKRIVIPSPKVATYDLKPEMSAPEVTDAVVNELNKQEHHFVCLNFANTDMVGHTGVYDAIYTAVITVDQCLERVVDAAQNNNYEVIIIADHGNADYAINSDGSPNTAHSLNPVPCVYVSKNRRNVKLQNGILADVAPTLLAIMGIKQPEVMTGKCLF